MDPITAFLINLIIGVVLSAASTLLSQAFAPKPEEQRRRTGTRGATQFGGKVPQYFLVGTVGEPGKAEYRNAWGSSGGVPNAYNVDVISFGDLPITGMIGLFVNGVRVTVEESGTAAQGNPVPEYSGNLWWKFYDGSQTEADAYLLDKFGSDADRPWESDMIGRGVPYLIATARWKDNLWTGFPSYMGEFQGIPLYDPREDDTAGGEGDQRWADPSTWTFSDNNAVIIYNIERGIHYDGARIWGGNATAAQLPYDVWASAMDACDEAIALDGGGTEKRFRAGLRIELNQRPADVIKELLIGANARISHASDGMIYIMVGVPEEADAAFSDADVLATEPLGTIPFPNLDDIINGATATYREPEQAWEDKETAPYLRSDLEAEDDGRQQIEGLDLGTTFSGTQAQRIIKAVIEEGRRFRRHVVALPPEFAQFRPLQVLAWTSDRFDYDQKLFLITARTRSPWGQVVLGLQEIDPADHAWVPATDEQPLSFAPVVTNRPPPQEVSGFSVAPAIALDSDGNGRRPAIDVFWSAASVTEDVRAVRITIRLAATEALVWEGEAPRPELGEARITQALLPNEDYEVQIQYEPESGRETIASSWLPVTTPNVLLGALDVDIGGALGAVGDQLAWLGEGTRQAIRNLEALGTLLAEQDLANYEDKNILRREINSRTGNITADYLEAIEAATGASSAIVQKIESLTAAMGGDTAQINTRWVATATAAGYAASYGLEAAVDADGLFRSAAFGVNVPESELSPTQFWADADQIVFTSDGGATFNALFADGTTFIDIARIADASIIEAKIGDAAITTAKINDAAITSAKIDDAAITSAKIETLTVDTIHLKDGAVTTSVSASLAGGNFNSSNPRSVEASFPAYETGAVLISFSGTLTITSWDSSGGTTAQRSLIRRDNVAGTGTTLKSQTYRGVDEEHTTHSIDLTFVDMPPAAGDYTYIVRITTGQSFPNNTYTTMTVVGMNAKK